MWLTLYFVLLVPLLASVWLYLKRFKYLDIPTVLIVVGGALVLTIFGPVTISFGIGEAVAEVSPGFVRAHKEILFVANTLLVILVFLFTPWFIDLMERKEKPPWLNKLVSALTLPGIARYREELDKLHANPLPTADNPATWFPPIDEFIQSFMDGLTHRAFNARLLIPDITRPAIEAAIHDFYTRELHNSEKAPSAYVSLKISTKASVPEAVLLEFRERLFQAFMLFVRQLPQGGDTILQTKFHELVSTPQLIWDISNAIVPSYRDAPYKSDDHHGLFHELYQTIVANRWTVTKAHLNKKEIAEDEARINPGNYPGTSASAVSDYCRNTPLYKLLSAPVPAPIEPKQRLEHMFINAPSGVGKTQCLQNMLASDLEKVKRGEATIVVIDSQGVNKHGDGRDPTIIQNLINLQVFATELKGKLTYVNPAADLAFNLFDMGQHEPHLTDAERGARRNAAYNVVLNSISYGSSLQKRMLERCIELALLADEPTIRTLQNILSTEQKAFSSQFSGLLKRADEVDPDIRKYFTTTFFAGTPATKEALANRVDGIVATPMFRAILRKPRSQFYMIDEIEAAKVIVINADSSPGMLGREGAEAFGRFFLAQLAYASRQRKSATPVYVYCDEAHFFVGQDENIVSMLHEARKQFVGIILATSALHLVSPTVRESMEGVAIVLEYEKGMPKHTFNLHLRNRKDPIVVTNTPGVLERMPRMTDEQFAEVHRSRVPPPPQLIPQPLKPATNDDDVIH